MCRNYKLYPVKLIYNDMYRYCSKYSKMKCVSLFMCLTVNNCYKSLQHIVYEAAVSLTVLV